MAGGTVPTRAWFLNLQILTSGGFRYAVTHSTTSCGGMWEVLVSLLPLTRDGGSVRRCNGKTVLASARVSSSYLEGCDVGCTCNGRRRGRLAWYPTLCTLWWRLACHLSSQACQPLAVPLILCNLLRKKPAEKVMPTGTGFAFS